MHSRWNAWNVDNCWYTGGSISMAINELNDRIIRLDLYLTQREYRLLKKVAEREGIGVGMYISNIVRGWTVNQIKGKYRKLFDEMNILECANLFGDITEEGEPDFEKSAVKREKLKVADKYSPDKEK